MISIIFNIILVIVLVVNAQDYRVSQNSILLEPSKSKDLTNSVLVFVPGALIDASKYVPMLRKIQMKSEHDGVSLWISIPSFPANVWITDGQIESAVRYSLTKTLNVLREKNVKTEEIDIFYGGHSRGCSSLQTVFESLVAGNRSDDVILKNRVSGFVFMACSLSRAFRDKTIAQIPRITIGGELDGLYRIFRVAESVYHEIDSSLDRKKSILQNPIYVIKGASHQSFFDGEPSVFVSWNDIPPEITKEEGFNVISALVNDFISYRILKSSSHEKSLLSNFNEGYEYFKVILEGFKLEGSYHLKAACSETKNPECYKGSPWTEKMQAVISTLPKVKVIDRDEFWKVWLIPFHLPKINGSCTIPDEKCTLSTSSVTELAYDRIDSLDSGFSVSSSLEMKVKMSSRQAIYKAAGVMKANFTSLDDYNFFCSELNQLAIDWAVANADEVSLARYYLKGSQIEVGEDKGPYTGGVSWIWTSLEFRKKENGGKSSYSLHSPTMRTPTDYLIPMAAGYHYCKLISPARALEWIYIDSLKRQSKEQ